MKTTIIYPLFLILFSLSFVACGGYNESVVQKADKGFIKFVGDPTALTIVVDDGASFSPDPKTEQYQVKPGKHTVKLYRNNQLILNKIVFVDNQTTMEIQIP